jgi:hypothetical protein
MKDVLRVFEKAQWSQGYADQYQKKNLLHRRPAKLTFKVVKIDGSEMVVTKVDPVPVPVDDDDDSTD